MVGDSRWYRVVELLEDRCRQRDSATLLSTLFNEIDDPVPAFNSHFNRCCPAAYDWSEHRVGPVAWSRYADSEYDSDFNLPLRIGHSLGLGFYDHVIRREVILCVHRERGDAGFCETDVSVVQHLRPLVERLFGLVRSSEAAEVAFFERLELPASLQKLSPREAEIARLLCTRPTLKRIADRLRISPRTVESHAVHSYQKLAVSGRQDLAVALGSPHGSASVTTSVS